MRHFPGALCRSMAIVVVSGTVCGAALAQTTSPYSDAWITTKLKLALLTESNLNSNSVHVDTIEGRVTLYGKVINESQKTKAEAAAKDIDGVGEVRNLLQIVPEQHAKAVNESDDTIKNRVAKLLKDDVELEDSDITVKSVNKGVVLLTGRSKTLSESLRAVESASSVGGVRGVANEIESSNEIADVYLSEASGSKPIGASDALITVATKVRLLADPEVPALEINVDTYHGVVTLFGIVPSSKAKAAAERDARMVSSVRAVDNNLQVLSASAKKKATANDDNVKRDVKLTLARDNDFKNVAFEVKNGMVHLTGTVGNGWKRLRAATVVRASKGVRAVQNDIHLEKRSGSR